MAKWGLAETLNASEGDAGRTSGAWLPTKLGMDFVLCGVKVPKHLYIYNNQVVAASEERCDVIEALGNDFDYAELMAKEPKQ